MEPISAALTGIALVQKSVDFIKSNIATANDIKDIAGALDGLFAGEKQVQKERFSEKSMLGQTKDAASKVIDAKLAAEAMHDGGEAGGGDGGPAGDAARCTRCGDGAAPE